MLSASESSNAVHGRDPAMTFALSNEEIHTHIHALVQANAHAHDLLVEVTNAWGNPGMMFVSY